MDAEYIRSLRLFKAHPVVEELFMLQTELQVEKRQNTLRRTSNGRSVIRSPVQAGGRSSGNYLRA